MPRIGEAEGDAKVIHIGVRSAGEPRYPFREFEADLLVAGDPGCGSAHAAREPRRRDEGNKAIDARRKSVAAARAEHEAKRDKLLDSVKDQTPIHPAWLAHCLNQVKAKDAIVVNELGVPRNRSI